MVFHLAAAHLAAAQGHSVHGHAAPAAMSRARFNFFPPQPRLCAGIRKRQLFPVGAASTNQNAVVAE